MHIPYTYTMEYVVRGSTQKKVRSTRTKTCTKPKVHVEMAIKFNGQKTYHNPYVHEYSVLLTKQQQLEADEKMLREKEEAEREKLAKEEAERLYLEKIERQCQEERKAFAAKLEKDNQKKSAYLHLLTKLIRESNEVLVSYLCEEIDYGIYDMSSYQSQSSYVLQPCLKTNPHGYQNGKIYKPEMVLLKKKPRSFYEGDYYAPCFNPGCFMTIFKQPGQLLIFPPNYCSAFQRVADFFDIDDVKNLMSCSKLIFSYLSEIHKKLMACSQEIHENLLLDSTVRIPTVIRKDNNRFECQFCNKCERNDLDKCCLECLDRYYRARPVYFLTLTDVLQQSDLEYLLKKESRHRNRVHFELVPDVQVRHLKCLMTKEKYWKLATECLRIRLKHNITIPKRCKSGACCCDLKPGHLANFSH